MSWRVEIRQPPLSHPSGIMTTFAWLLRQIGVDAVFDAMLVWDPKQCKLSPGTRLLALILAVLFDRTALYRVEQVFAHQDLPVLFGPEVAASDFNDDALGRALDKLAAAPAGPATVFTTITARIWSHEGIPLGHLHGDTSAVAVYGQYRGDGSPTELHIVRGHSKEHRPDLPQIGLGYVNCPEGIPLLADVHDGNLSDNTWNHQVIDRLAQLLPAKQLRQIVYTADCKLVSPDNLLAMEEKGLIWLSRLPDTYAAAHRIRDLAWAEDRWDEPDKVAAGPRASRYKLCEFPDVALSTDPKHPLAARRYRAIAVHSSSLQAKAEHRQAEELAAELAALAAAPWAEAVFPTEELALRQAAAILKKLHLRHHHLELVPVPTSLPGKRSPGRPRKDAPPPPPRTGYRLQPQLIPPDPEELQRRIRHAATFVLVTNDRQRSPRELLHTYKGQQEAVEIPFHRTKAMPVAPVFLERPERVRALGYVLLIAYAAYAILQRRVRHRLAERHEAFITWDNRLNPRPTANVVMQHLDEIRTEIVQEGTDIVRVIKLTDPARHLLELLGVPLEMFGEVRSAPGP
jgi:transposase